MRDLIIESLKESTKIKELIAKDYVEDIIEISRLLIKTFKQNGKVLLIGNGGSSADASHIASELVGRLKLERKPLPAISLSTDTSVLTSLANDYGSDTIFSRQVEVLIDKKDVLIAISTSGASSNILKAVKVARSKKAKIVAFTGIKGDRLARLADYLIMVPSSNTQRIQEAHITIAHIICEIVEEKLFK